MGKDVGSWTGRFGTEPTDATTPAQASRYLRACRSNFGVLCSTTSKGLLFASEAMAERPERLRVCC